MRSRAQRDQQRLDSGAVTSPKDLKNLQDEVASLAKRQSDLEEEVLEVMERRDDRQSRVTDLSERERESREKLDDAERRRDEAAAGIDTESNDAARQRETIATVIPTQLMELYTKLRSQHGGVAAARLYQGRCEGCRTEFAITELSEIRNAAKDTVVRCENCRRILVRTAESGL